MPASATNHRIDLNFEWIASECATSTPGHYFDDRPEKDLPTSLKKVAGQGQDRQSAARRWVVPPAAAGGAAAGATAQMAMAALVGSALLTSRCSWAPR